MIILIYVSNYNHIFFSNIFVIGKIRIMEFHPPPTENFDDFPYPYGTPKFRIIFMKRCVIGLVNYSKKKQRGRNNHLLQRTRVNLSLCVYSHIKRMHIDRDTSFKFLIYFEGEFFKFWNYTKLMLIDRCYKHVQVFKCFVLFFFLISINRCILLYVTVHII